MSVLRGCVELIYYLFFLFFMPKPLEKYFWCFWILSSLFVFSSVLSVSSSFEWHKLFMKFSKQLMVDDKRQRREARPTNIIRIRGGLVYRVLVRTDALEMNLMASSCIPRSRLTADGLPDTKQASRRRVLWFKCHFWNKKGIALVWLW